jgi:uncharacterized membrane-anchored protein YjiN (DUF445 family)
MKLINIKAVAHLLLLFALIGFISCSLLQYRLYQDSSYLHFCKSVFEAALIGGLADWFAVTALFRHPLGIPIPHTAIIPNQKKKIAKAFGKFLSENFLRQDVLERRFLQISLTSRLKKFLSDNNNTIKITKFLTELCEIIDVSSVLRNKKSIEYIQNLIIRIAHSPVGNNLFDAAVDKVYEAITKEELSIKSQISKKLPWFLPSFIDDKIYAWLIASISEWLQNWRHKTLNQGIQSNPELIKFLEGDKFNSLLTQLVNSEVLTDSFKNIISSKSWEDRINSFLRMLNDDPQFESKFEQVLQRLAISVASYIADPFSRYVSRTIEQWDNKQASDLLEAQFGSDLQYIRINGTILGGIIGGALYLLNYAAKSF